ncbi:hypothetical protein Slin15195_G110200 [Septoria linicola]|uniref:Uncharacterized protein n=1 Tax=Septoria linicola TaxID=215465 RepID=A0A9Q9B7B2_9PEZI|nr:hypothetical protein Slin15195_G110200 [Septoria linicola]
MLFLIPTMLALASGVAADWLIQEYGGAQCTGARINDIRPFVSGQRECRAIDQPGVTSSLLRPLDQSDTGYRFELHNDGDCIDPVRGALTLRPGNNNACFFSSGSRFVEIIPL